MTDPAENTPDTEQQRREWNERVDAAARGLTDTLKEHPEWADVVVPACLRVAAVFASIDDMNPLMVVRAFCTNLDTTYSAAARENAEAVAQTLATAILSLHTPKGAVSH